ncbi:MAG TPA: bifunctional 5,10-methylenetetrahydrofolate dehydrogenase/5,10-methenyltetrahydrofolate cyclohydrolase [Polyangiaceae bacterium]|jgi:methylenetetrahydrofolate dehydrogenase (NADP+)/methenyltetrahydrofolate cyclohydrolase
MAAKLLDGKDLAARIRQRIAAEVSEFVARSGRAPGLSIVLNADDPSSASFVRGKDKAAREVGMVCRVHPLPTAVSETELVGLVRGLGDDPTVDGVVVQLPLPHKVRREGVFEALDPKKDVDGLHPLNQAALWENRAKLVPCTPAACLRLIAESGLSLAGALVVVVGRSALVGKPTAALLLAADATVTVAHRRTRDLPSLCRQADALVVAAGQPGLVRGDWVKPGAVVIDVGLSRDSEGKLRGDVDFDSVFPVAGALTPAPGGVGPMTVAMLLENTLLAARERVQCWARGTNADSAKD